MCLLSLMRARAIIMVQRSTLEQKWGGPSRPASDDLVPTHINNFSHFYALLQSWPGKEGVKCYKFFYSKTFLVVIYFTNTLRTIQGSKLLSLMKERGGVPRFTLPTRVYTRAGETAAHASQCRIRRRVQGRVMPSHTLDYDVSD